MLKRCLTIRRGTEADREFVRNCMKELFMDCCNSNNPPKLPRFDRTYDYVVRNPDFCPFFIAEDNGKQIGMISCNSLNSLSQGFSKLNIADIVVASGNRGKSIGTKLLNHVVQYARDNGYHAIELIQPKEGSRYHEERTKFYTKNGFDFLGPGCMKVLDDTVLELE